MVKRVARSSSERPKAFAGSMKGEADSSAKTRTRGSRSRAAQASRAEAAIAPRAAHGAAPNALHAGADALSGEMGGIAAAVAVGLGAALLEAELIPGILLGAGAMLLGKMVPQLNEGMRPLVKAAVGAGLTMADKTRSVLAEAGEQVQDVVAEVRAERRQQGTGKSNRHERAPAADHDSAGAAAKA